MAKVQTHNGKYIRERAYAKPCFFLKNCYNLILLKLRSPDKIIIKKMKNKNNYFFYLILCVLVAGLFYWGYHSGNSQSLVVKNGANLATVKNALDFINKNLLAEGYSAEVESVEEENGVYKLNLKIDEEITSVYLTKNGKTLFLSAVDLAEAEKTINNENNGPQAISKCEDINKSDSPVLEAFIVSQCPFGLQMQRILNEAIKSIPQLENFITVEYIGEIENNQIQSMHGEEEAQENLRQICLREEQKDKYWPYVECYMKEGKIAEYLSSTGVDQEKLTSCMKDTNRGIAYAQKDFTRQDEFKVDGSPTLIINNELVSEFGFGGRNPEAIKQIICCAAQNKLSFCDQTLSTEEAAASFSSTYSDGNSGASASCQ